MPSRQGQGRMRGSRGLWRRVGAVLSVVTAIVLATAGAAQGQADPVKLRVIPETIALQPGAAKQQVVVIAERGAALTFVAAKLEALAAPGLEVAVRAAPTLPSMSELAWTIEVAATARATKETTLVFRLDYQADPEKPGARVAGTAAATAKVSYAALSLAQSLKITIHHGFDTLQASRKGVVLLAIENSGIDDVVLDGIAFDRLVLDQLKPAQTATLPENIKSVTAAVPVKIPGRDTTWVRVIVEATDRVVPGTTPLPLELSFSRGVGPPWDSRTVALVDTVTFGVPGFSDIKAALQIPSLLMLPGLLVVLTWSLLWKLQSWAGAQPGDPAAPEFPLTAGKPEFYVVAITVSFLVAFAYPLFRGEDIGLLERVSTIDVALIWFGSIILVAPLSYALAVLGAQAYRNAQIKAKNAEIKRKEAERQRVEPLTSDTPEIILRKLASLRQTLMLDAHNIKTAPGHTQLLFKLGFGDGAASETSWLAAAILIKVDAGAADLEQGIDDAIENDDIAALVTLLDMHNGNYTIQWEAIAGGSDPRQVENSELDDMQGQQSIVRRT